MTIDQLSQLRSHRPVRRRWPLVVAAVLVPALVAAAVIWVTRTRGSAAQTARDYLAAWQRRDYPAMRRLVADPPADFERWHRNVEAGLKLTRVAAELRETGEGRARFHATLSGRGPDLAYDGRLRLVERDREWKVAWSPAAIHPELAPGRRLTLVTAREEAVPVLAADGTRIDTPGTPGSIQQIVASLKARHGDRLTVPGVSRIVLSEGDRAVRTLAERAAARREPFRTTLDLRHHRAGAAALERTRKPAALVAMRASTGEVLAVVNNRGGFDRALMGKYPPGSTFKVVTASALVAAGMRPGQIVRCPAEQNIGGFTFHNAHFHDFGSLPFRDAFAHSCNTTFGAQAVARLGARRLAKVAGDFGFGVPIDPGVPAVRADFPAPKDDTDLASASIGQGRVLASPLNMAGVAAAIAGGVWRSPRLVPAGLVPTQERALEPAVVEALRELMPAVVSEGTAHAVRFPPGTAGKTGTAEYGSGEEPPTHSWFIGYRGDLAFAVVVEGGGEGAAVAAPIAAGFLARLS
ncbi:penicillin-binding transpeptidase domain-containing protein [Thermoactinospora rubra]|uniref:penicillin-binding transpeptidase domain-containing protein n=1 Tax=Thermoactinospora rubra TaxID=1088767 RepID=UPI000A11CAB7|nr:penicillin-binding transpeptidase domain-containing protein [Thermoactinospora rubra]